ncbi:hypothetical protein ALI144C_51490 [Actinosynnema sp. ALI-1.44]|nr:hypothetical protein ALI144C_51490 [Actinosynnema sp. ALI-1.44]
MDPDAAAEFLQQFHTENPSAGDMDRRLAWVMAAIDLTGTYQHTTAELAYGAQLAWRNSARCIGRLYWRSLRVRDCGRSGRHRRTVRPAPEAGVERRQDPAVDLGVRPAGGRPARAPDLERATDSLCGVPEGGRWCAR